MSKASKKATGVVINIPDCPVCMEDMCVPIFQCKSGHSLCHNCTRALMPPLCPICRQDMTQIRNLQLEEIVNQVKTPCPNQAKGCIYTMKKSELETHLTECIFRTMNCPMGEVLGKCSWIGALNKLMDHFKDRHPKNTNLQSDVAVEIDKINLNEDERYLYLISEKKYLFIMTLKLDTMQKMAYWTIQHLGSRNAAHHYVYEIHVLSKVNPERKYIYTDNCYNISLKADEVFNLGKCAMLSLETLKHFIKNNKLSFKYFIKMTQPLPPKNEGAKGTNGKPNGDNKPKGKVNKQPGPKNNNRPMSKVA